jgi:arylsulfatase A-like enzyme
MPSWHGVHDHLNGMGHPGIGSQATLADAFKNAGYLTAQIGKWHCHTSEDNGPHNGFDRWFSHAAGTNARFGVQHFWDQNCQLERHGYQAPMITEQAIAFLRQAADGEAPFMCAIGYTETHRPFEDVPTRLINRYHESDFTYIPAETMPRTHGQAKRPFDHAGANARNILQRYHASTSYIDEQVGCILDELDNLGLRNETMVIYTADHGLCVGHHGLVGKGNASVPQNFFDENIFVPFIVHLPGRIEGGRCCTQAICHTDTCRTLLDMLGCDIPDAAPRPGRSWLPLVASRTPDAESWPADIICEYGNARMIRTDRFKLIRRYAGPNGHFGDELYDLSSDQQECHNVIDTALAQAVIAPLDTRLEQFFSDFSHPERNGLHIAALPPANNKEPWRTSPS